MVSLSAFFLCSDASECIYIPDALSVTAMERNNPSMLALEQREDRFGGYHLQSSFCPCDRPKKEPKQRNEDHSDDGAPQEYDFGDAFPN